MEALLKQQADLLANHTKLFDSILTTIQTLGYKVMRMEREIEDLKTIIQAERIVGKR